MVVLYVLKRFFKLFLGFALLFGGSFFLMQVKSVEEYILNKFVGDIKFDRIDGVFPFDFHVYGLKAEFEETNVFIDKCHVMLSKSMTSIKKISAKKVVVKDKTNNREKNINIKDYIYFIPFLSQTFIKNADVSDLVIDDKNFGSIESYLNAKKTGRVFVLKTKQGIMCFSSVILNNIFYSKLSYDKKYLYLNYNLNFGNIEVFLKNDFDDISRFSGILENNSVSGNLKIKGLEDNIFLTATPLKISVNVKLSSKMFDGTVLQGAYMFDDSSVKVDFVNVANMFKIKPFTINCMKVSDIDCVVGSGNILIKNINLNDDNFNLGDWSFKNIDLSFFRNKIKEIPNGILNGSCSYKNNAENFKFKLNKFSYGTFILPDVDINGDYSKNNLNIEAKYKLLQKENSIKTKIMCDNWLISENSQAELKGKGYFNIEDSIKKISGQHIGGRLKYDVNAQGKIKDIKIKGEFSLKDGIYANESVGTCIKDINIKSHISDKKIIIDKISATDDCKKQGRITGKGNIFLDEKGAFAEINMDVDSLSVVDIKEFDGKIKGKLSISGNLAENLKITGELETTKADVDISNVVKMSSYSIDIVDSVKEKKKKEKRKISWKCPLDIKLLFKPCVKVTGFGINSEWDGGINISGDTSFVKYDGVLKLRKGNINVSGKKMSLKDGKVCFSDKNPDIIFIEVSAIKSLDSTKVGAKFIQDEKGVRVSLFSNTHLQQKDILSYILFEKSVSEISSGEAITLYSISNNLSGRRDFDIIGKIKSVLGLDVLDIKRNQSNEHGEYNTISIGKKIGKMNISVDQGAGEHTTKVVVDTKIAKNTKLTVDLSGNDAIGAGIAWQKRY